MAKAQTARQAVTTRREDLAGTVEAIRKRLAGLQSEREHIDEAPVTEAEALERVDRLIDMLAARAREKLTGGQFFTPRRGPIDGLFSVTTSPEEVAVLFSPDSMRAALHAYVAERADGLDTLPIAGRAKRLAEIDAAILAAETEEEGVIETSEDMGLPIARRPDANPAVVLGWQD